MGKEASDTLRVLARRTPVLTKRILVNRFMNFNIFKTSLVMLSIGLLASGCCCGESSSSGSGTVPASSANSQTKVIGKGPDSRKPPSFSNSHLLATCLKKKEGTCDGYYDFIPTDTPNDCVKEGGEFKKSSEDCPSDGFVATCAYPAKKHGDPAQLHSLYASAGKPAIEAAKKDCLEQVPESMRLPSDIPKEWIEATPAIKKPAASPSSKGK